MFPNKAKMVRAANALLVILGIAPVVYIGIAAGLAFGGHVFAGNPSIVPFLLPGLAAVSIANTLVIVNLQRRWRPVAGQSPFLVVSRVYLSVSMGAILSEAHSIYGLVLTLLSGSIIYVIGFSLVAWASLLWVRSRFKQDLAKIPNE